MMRFSMGLVAVCWIPVAALAQPAPADPDWPCNQRLVATLSGGEFWSGPEPKADPGWRDDQPVFELVTAVTDRDTPQDQANAKLAAYADGIPKAQRAAVLPKLFGAIVEQINEERTDLIGRLKHLGHRQRGMSDRITELSAAADAIPDTATGADAARKADITADRDLVIRGFQQTQKSMRYACEAPGALDRRLGVFAQTLMGKMK